MVIKYARIFHCKTLQNLPKIGIFGLKTNHLATLSTYLNEIMFTVSFANQTKQTLPNYFAILNKPRIISV
jgi:hypothetical protein